MTLSMLRPGRPHFFDRWLGHNTTVKTTCLVLAVHMFKAITSYTGLHLQAREKPVEFCCGASGPELGSSCYEQQPTSTKSWAEASKQVDGSCPL